MLTYKKEEEEEEEEEEEKVKRRRRRKSKKKKKKKKKEKEEKKIEKSDIAGRKKYSEKRRGKRRKKWKLETEKDSTARNLRRKKITVSFKYATNELFIFLFTWNRSRVESNLEVRVPTRSDISYSPPSPGPGTPSKSSEVAHKGDNSLGKRRILRGKGNGEIRGRGRERKWGVWEKRRGLRKKDRKCKKGLVNMEDKEKENWWLGR